MSWRSPFTVPMTTVPAERTPPVRVRMGFRTAMPAFMARAATRTCGT